MRAIIPIVLILISIGLFVVYINPTYANIKTLQTSEAQFDEALERSKDLISIRDQLLSRYNTFSSEDLSSLDRLLPDNIDNVRLVIDIDGIAAQYGISLKKVSIDSGEEEAKRDGEIVVIDDSKSFNSIDLSFTVSASYESFVNFISDVERSLRIVDLSKLQFESTNDNFNEYKVTIRTYWLQ